jgi:hypothetical protein
MVNINSGQLGNQVQLESLDSIRANANNSNNLQQPDNNSGLQSLDSIRANNYSDPNLSIPANDILAPIEAINPELPERSREDTKERGTTGFIGGVFRGFGTAGIDTVVGVVKLTSVVASGLVHPAKTLNWVGGGVKYAVNHPLKAIETVALDLPAGIVKGIVNPYKEAIKQGQYGQAVGRGIFDIGLILLTAGVGEEGAAGKAGTVTEVVDKGGKGTKVVDAAAEVTKVVEASEGAQIVTKGVEGGIRIGKDAIKITGKVNGNVIINIGNTTANVTTTAAKVGAKTAAATTEAVVGAVETAAKTGTISLGLADLGKAMGRGFGKLTGLFKPVAGEIGAGLNSGLTAIVGENAASVIRTTASTIGHGVAVGGKVIKDGAVFVKAHPVASALISGKATDILDKGLKASDHYNPND